MSGDPTWREENESRLVLTDEAWMLADGAPSVLIRVNNIDVYIVRTDEGVVVEMLPEWSDIDWAYCIGETWALFTDADRPEEVDE